MDERVTLCCVSDTHGDHAALDPLPEADVLLHAGDFTNFGRDDHARAFDAWGASQPQPRERRILVLGNHENRWVQDGALAELRALLPSWTLLHHETHQAAGLTFYGIPFLPEHESEYQTVRLPAGIDVLVTHNPPCGNLDGGGSGHVALRQAAKAAQPKLHVFGHIHADAGTERVAWRDKVGTLLVNAASCLVRKVTHPPIVVAVARGPAGSADEVAERLMNELYCPLALAKGSQSDAGLELESKARLEQKQELQPESEPKLEPEPEREPEPEPSEQKPTGNVAPDTNGTQLVCGRFRQMKLCGCTIPCRVSMNEVTISEIRPGLYIGPVEAAYKWDQLVTKGITSIVDLSSSTYDRNPTQDYLCIEVDDEPSADIISAIRKALPFIRACIERGDGVLVHCKAGKSRSATICAAWLMAREGLDAKAAIAAVKARHKRADPNLGFREALDTCKINEMLA